MITVETEAFDLDTAIEQVRRERAAGRTRIGLEPGDVELRRDVLERLREAGLTGLRVQILGRQAAHDYLRGHAGAFARSMQTSRNAQELGLDCLAHTIVTRSNFRELRFLPPMIGAATGWVLELPRLDGRTGFDLHLHTPRLGMATPHALAAIANARQRGLRSWIRGAPLCLLGPHTKWAAPRPSAEFGPRCDACAARPACAGLEAIYLDRFGAGELAPVHTPPETLPLPESLAYLCE